MTTDEVLAQVAEMYRREGYDVVTRPDPAELPEALRRPYPAVVARRGPRAVLAEVYRRGQVQDLPPDPLPAGWNYDAILMPREDWAGAPGPGPGPTPEFAHSLITEIEEMIPRAAVRARFLVAWAAAEAALRVAAARNEVEGTPERTPRDLLGRLEAAGVLTPDRTAVLRDLLAQQTRLCHGTPTEPIEPWWADHLITVARELLSGLPVAMAS